MGCNCTKRAVVIGQAVKAAASGNIQSATSRASVVAASLAKDARAATARVLGRSGLPRPR